MPKYEELNGTQQGSYDKLQTSIKEGENIINLLTGFSKEDLLKILTTVKCFNSNDQEHTLTLLGYAISLKNSLSSQRYITNILNVAKEKDILEEVLTNANIKIKFPNGQECTLTPLVNAIAINKQKGIQAILDVAERNSILEKVLTTANIKIRPSDGEEHTLTPLDYAISLDNQEASHKSIEAILDAAKNDNMLEKAFANVRKDHLNKTKEVLEILKNQEQDEKEKTKIDGWLEVLKKIISGCESQEQSSVAESSVPQTEGNITKDTVKTTNKPIIIGSVCGAIAALAVGLGLYFSAALPVLPIIGIAVAAAVLVGLVAGGITYVMSKLSENLDIAKVRQGVVDSKG
ncbi:MULTISPECIES: magnesium transporter [unclassified Wolbachia]|uniref:WD_0033/WD_0034 family tandem repeat-containing protein n=1 Tax=unclassified Wolbachia TaxID=2640676 RepID=UPI003132CFBF